MTAQLPDRIELDGRSRAMLGCLVLPERVLGLSMEQLAARAPHTACWRGYVATYAVRDGRLLLCGVEAEGGRELAEPILADWITGVVRVIDGPMLDYVHMGFDSGYAAVLELRVRRGEVLASRRVAVPEGATRGISDETPLWELLPDAPRLVVNPYTDWCVSTATLEERAWHRPEEGGPRREAYVLAGFRARVRAERLRRGWQPSDLAAAIGKTPFMFGARLHGWEEGEPILGDDSLDKIVDVLGLDRAELAALEAKEEAAYAVACERWRTMPFVPAVAVWADRFVYVAPPAVRGDDEALEVWAQAMADLTWERVRFIRGPRDLRRFDPRP